MSPEDLGHFWPSGVDQTPIQFAPLAVATICPDGSRVDRHVRLVSSKIITSTITCINIYIYIIYPVPMISPLNGCWIPMFHTPWLHMILWHPNHSIDASWWTQNCKNPIRPHLTVSNAWRTKHACPWIKTVCNYSLSIYPSIHVNLIINLYLYVSIDM